MYTSPSEVIRESLRLMHTYEEIQKQRIARLSRAVDIGMEQLRRNQTVDSSTSRENIKRKIDAFAKGK